MSFASLNRMDSDLRSEESRSNVGSVSDRWSVTDRSTRLARMKEKKEEIQRKVDQMKGTNRQRKESEDDPINRQSSPPIAAVATVALGTLNSFGAASSGGDLSNKSADQLVDLSMKMEKMGSEISAQQKQLTELVMTVQQAASQKGLEECKMRMEDQHKVHLEEMHRLQQSFANDSECQGLRVQLDASKQREQSLETQQVLLERSWSDEKQNLEKQVAQLRSRETALVQQLQQAIVEVPPTPSPDKTETAERKIRISIPKIPRPRIFLGLAGFVGLVLAMTAHFKWRHAATPQKHRGLSGPLGRAKRAHLRG